MLLIVGGGIILAGCVVGYLVGIFDRPLFEYQETLVMGDDNDAKKQTFLYAIVAFSTEPKIGQHIERILDGVKMGLLGQPNGKALMTAASQLYGPPANSEDGYIEVELYFDDPEQTEHPRWLAGYAVQADTFEEIQNLLSDVQKKSGLTKEIIRAVRVGCGSSVLKASIPYRSRFTCMIATMIQWKRAFHTYEKGSYQSECGRSHEEVAAIALALYFGTFSSMNSKGCLQALEYIVLMGDTKITWDDAIPLPSDPNSDIAITQ